MGRRGLSGRVPLGTSIHPARSGLFRALGEARLAVHGAIPARLERHLALLLAVGANGFVHFPRPPRASSRPAAEPPAKPTHTTLIPHRPSSWAAPAAPLRHNGAPCSILPLFPTGCLNIWCCLNLAGPAAAPPPPAVLAAGPLYSGLGPAGLAGSCGRAAGWLRVTRQIKTRPTPIVPGNSHSIASRRKPAAPWGLSPTLHWGLSPTSRPPSREQPSLPVTAKWKQLNYLRVASVRTSSAS